MHLLAISLLSILAGTLLLAKFRKEMAGKFFTIISWFFIVVGFLLFIGSISFGICRMANHCCPGQPGFHHEMMMKNCGHGTPGGKCCPEGMDKGMCSGMSGCDGGQGMDKGMCSGKQGCTGHESMGKCCPEQKEGDSAIVPVQKK